MGLLFEIQQLASNSVWIFFSRNGSVSSVGFQGATLIHTSTRRPPNAFHFRRQIMILERAGSGGSAQQFQDFTSVVAVIVSFNAQ